MKTNLEALQSLYQIMTGESKEFATNSEALEEIAKNYSGGGEVVGGENTKKWLVLGDSVSAGYGATIKYSDIIGERYNINTVDNKAVAGSTVFNYNDSTKTNNCVARLSQITDKKTYTHASICYGINDVASIIANQDSDGVFTTIIGDTSNTASSTPTTLCSALMYVIETLLEANPAMKILLMCDNAKYEAVYTENTRKAFEAVDEAFELVAKKYKIEYLSLYRYFPTTNKTRGYYLQSDTVHPTDEGQKAIADIIVAHNDYFFKSNNYSANVNEDDTEDSLVSLYSLGTTEFDGATAIDTNLKLFTSERTQFTIFVDFIVPSTASNRLFTCKPTTGSIGMELGIKSNGSYYGMVANKYIVGALDKSDEVVPTAGDNAKMALTREGDVYTLYIDGEQHSQNTVSVADLDHNLFIGATVGESSTTNYFKGTINKFEVYDVCLTAEEIASL